MMRSATKKALIIGIDSTLGTALQEELLIAGWDVFGSTRRKEKLGSQNSCLHPAACPRDPARSHNAHSNLNNQQTSSTQNIFFLDLADLSDFHFSTKVDVVFLCASITKITSCRDDPSCHRINVDAQVELAKYFINQGVHVIFLSSSAVFDGKKTGYTIKDATCPVTAYGESKAIAEQKLLELANNVSIVRLSKVLTPNYPLIMKWLEELKAGRSIEPFNDLYLSPVAIKIVTMCLREIADGMLFGIIHLSGEEDVSYSFIAQCLADLIKAKPTLIRPKSVLSANGFASETLRYTSLDMTETMRLLALPSLSAAATLSYLYGNQGMLLDF
jgi:dTDP-4-dehydrorhamnose reductase